MIGAGDLNRRITISRRVSGTNAFNEPLDTWSPVSTVWAAVTPVSDGERMRAGETLAQKSSRFVVRYSKAMASVGPLDRIIFDRATYDIQGVKETSRREFLEITATARAE